MRRIIQLTGPDRLTFLNGLTTRDVPAEGLGYAALLTPQGKYLCDFFLWQTADAVMLDVSEALADDLLKRLGMYKLRAKVEIAATALNVATGTGTPPDGAMADPRHVRMGWRLYGAKAGDDGTNWDALRVAQGIPEAGRELMPGESYILEMGFERLHGVDFKKGCFVGQEIVARMKHKTELRKGLATIRAEGRAEGDTITDDAGKEVGTVHTVAGDMALAYLRFDRADGAVTIVQRWI